MFILQKFNFLEVEFMIKKIPRKDIESISCTGKHNKHNSFEKVQDSTKYFLKFDEVLICSYTYS
jgi:hypothetical protein